MRELKAADFWKNFRMGEEVHIAGAFIYNGLRRFHEMQLFDHSDELFEFIYNLSVGLERLLKIAVVLHEHKDSGDQEALEQSLITHSHLDLLARLRKHVTVNFGTPQNELLQFLSTFYKTLRYDRFSLNSVYKGRKEMTALLAYLGKNLNVEIAVGELPLGTYNDDRYRRFVRRTVLKISQAIYEIVSQQSLALGLYTYELRHGSKAQSVFLREVNVGDEDVLWKELLVYFMNAEPSTGYLKFLKETLPLPFDPALVPDYLDCFKSDAAKAMVMDELEHLYGEMSQEERKERIERVQVIGAPDVYFPGPDDDLDFGSFDSEDGKPDPFSL